MTFLGGQIQEGRKTRRNDLMQKSSIFVFS